MNNKSLLAAIRNSKAKGYISFELYALLSKIIKMSFDRRWKYIPGFEPTWVQKHREQIENHAMNNLTRHVLRFREDMSSNAFAYVYTSVAGSFCNYIAQEKRKNQELKAAIAAL